MKLQMQPETGGDSSFNILQKPDQILAFVKHALDSAREKQITGPPATPVRAPRRQGLSLADLRIVGDEDDDMPDDDSDDDSDDEEGGMDSEEEMTSTALNLLLSVLEANPELSAQSAPILDEIFTILKYLAKEGSESIRPLAREARMVLIARLASSSVPKSKNTKSNEESPEKKYQKALKLLQDPILPVRAHGLLLLRELVTPSKNSSERGAGVSTPVVDRALIPGILSIFLQSLQDDDSYIFLNAVQGLAAMVDGFGKEVLKGLVDTYAQGLEGIGGTALTKTDVDTRTRVGEALGQVIRRCGDALPDYVDAIADMLVPRFFALVRSSHLPATLRTSALSLLALCVTTNALAILPYAIDLASAMVDLLQVETVPVIRQPQAPTREQASDAGAEVKHEKSQGVTLEEVADDENTDDQAQEDQKQEEANPKDKLKIDSTEFKPTTTSSKIPPLRRAALHFLLLLIRAYIAQVDDASAALSEPSISISPIGPGTRRAMYVLPPDVLRRVRTTAAYVSSTDEDGIVRIMAVELVEALDGLAEAMLGL
ncbi:hypothetical protein EIP86_001041 [Pleurotus ostreatoroseus]|nr:hypothetical protein EIP86_001041 [Pleurotus ostreatoroseus]